MCKTPQEQIEVLQQRVKELERFEQAINLLEKGPLTSVSVLDTGEYHITVQSGIASVSFTRSAPSLVDAMISAGKY
jgi:hypothetical protein